MIQKIVDTLSKWAPTEQAEDFDNVGLIIGDINYDLTGVLISCLLYTSPSPRDS